MSKQSFISENIRYQIPDNLLSNNLNRSDFILQSSYFLKDLGMDLEKIQQSYFKGKYKDAEKSILSFAGSISKDLLSHLSNIVSNIPESDSDKTRQVYQISLGEKLWHKGQSSSEFQKCALHLNSFLMTSYDPIVTLNKRELATNLINEASSSGLSKEIKPGIAMRAASEFLDIKIDEQIKEHRARTSGIEYQDPSRLFDLGSVSQEEELDTAFKNVRIYGANSLKVMSRIDCIAMINSRQNHQPKVLRFENFSKSHLLTSEFLLENIIILDLLFSSKAFVEDKNHFARVLLEGVFGLILKDGQARLQDLESALQNSTVKKIIKKHKIDTRDLIDTDIQKQAFEETTLYSIESTLNIENQSVIENMTHRERLSKSRANYDQ